MKHFLIVLFVVLTQHVYSQMTVNELIKIHKMNFDQFDSYALAKGYELEEVEDKEKVNGVTYSKGTAKNTRYLSLYSTFYESGITVIYQTSNTSEYINFKNQLTSFGFKFYKKDTFTPSDKNYTSQVNEYRNSIFEIQIYSIPPHDGELVKYEISLNRL